MYAGYKVRDQYISELISQKQAKLDNNYEVTSGHRDLTTLLLKSKQFTSDQIRAQLFTFLFAGFETTSTTISSILYHLGDEPEWVEKINDEFEVSFKLLIKVKQNQGFVSSNQRADTETNALDHCVYQRNITTGDNR